MSAAAVPPSSRPTQKVRGWAPAPRIRPRHLSLVPAAPGGEEQRRPHRTGARRGTGRPTHLRPVPDVAAPVRPDGGGSREGGQATPRLLEMPPRRPGAPLVVRAPARRPSRMSLAHPAVRAGRHRLQRGGGMASKAVSTAPGAEGVCAPSVPAAVRYLAAGLVVTLVVAVLVAGGIVLSALGQPGYTGTSTAVVQPGQSLWDVASSTGSPDVAETVAVIVELNNLETPSVRAGQRLVVPVS
ncbi:LysM peptidoglycan-binding domain-containing protein [Actinomyces lilanjuaniae]|uniref:LysM peptidoglycan-binding domain-containing protein n=1 Tax=Actinomyces lilanjuaniae TaxID=2321394 RepID=UPI001FAAE1DB|nr:LysM peptidoglycan-binding domain-containing protein [Actinomyces lilanjuaniae]